TVSRARYRDRQRSGQPLHPQLRGTARPHPCGTLRSNSFLPSGWIVSLPRLKSGIKRVQHAGSRSPLLVRHSGTAVHTSRLPGGQVVAGSNPVSEPSVSPTRVLAVHGLVAWCQPGARVWLTLTRFLTTAVRGRQHLPRAAVAYLIQVWI